jgi:hypothetical protein
MVIKTFFDKSNTIVEKSNINYGLNPVTTLFYGYTGYSRYIFHFDLAYIKYFIGNKTFPHINKLKHKLVMYNSGSIDFRWMFNPCWTIDNKTADRASSFDLILFKVPNYWDMGKGYDNLVNTAFTYDQFQSCEGSNWFHRKTSIQWGSGDLGNHSHKDCGSYNGVVNGIYDNGYLQDQYRRFQNRESSIILRSQHFDFGSEQVSIDLTDIVNDMILCETAKPNYGFCLAFDPTLEVRKSNPIQCVNFFTEKTSTWFEPFIQTEYDENIHDNRADMYLDAPRRLYYYSNVGGKITNLEGNPKCKITGNYENGEPIEIDAEIKQATMGVYYIDLLLPSDNGSDGLVVPNRMLFDTWSNLSFYSDIFEKNVSIQPKTLEFTTKSSEEYYLGGDGDGQPQEFSPSIHGINHNEKISRDNGYRKVYVNFDIKYTVHQSKLLDDVWYKIYIEEGNKQNDWCDWQPINKTFNSNYFFIDFRSFIPHKYYIDIMISNGAEAKIHKNVLSFEVVNNETKGHYV